MKFKVCIFACTLAVLLAVVQAMPKSPWRRKRDTSSQCTSAIEHCDECKNPGLQSIKCKGNRIVSDDGLYCVTCPDHCDLYHCKDNGKGVTGTAVECLSGFRRDSAQNLCKACTTGCKKCKGDLTKCDANMCKDRYAYHSGTKLCTICHSNCANCSFPANTNTTNVALKCDKCNTDSYMQGVNCIKCGNGCKTCTDNKGCTACKDGTYSQPASTNSVDVVCHTCPGGCTKCTSATVCTECESTSGYTRFLENGVCETCSHKGLSNCIKCTADGSGSYMCDKCIKHYYVKDKKCSSCDGICDECKAPVVTTSSSSTTSTTPICETCPAAFGLALVQDSAVKICDKCPEHCTACSRLSNGTTVCNSGQCKSGYARNSVGSLCLPCPTDCHACEYDSGSGGTVCSQGRCHAATVRSDVTKLCVKCPSNCCSCRLNKEQTPECIACNYRFALNPTTKSCIQCGSNCNACSVHSGTGVVSCMRQQCEAGFYITSQGLCANCDVGNCVYCKEHNKCIDCKSGYIKSATGATCSLPAQTGGASCPGGCSNCTTAVTPICTACTNGIAPTTSTMCFGLLGCSVVGLVGRQLQCTQCATGYIKHMSVCHKCPPYCDICQYAAGKTECTTCSSGYGTSTSGRCAICGAHCSICTSKGAGKCDNVVGNCAAGYYYNSDQCPPCDQSSLCSSCSSGAVAACSSPKSKARVQLTVGTLFGTPEECQVKDITVNGAPEKLRYCISCTSSKDVCDVCIHGYVPNTVVGATDACVVSGANGDRSELVGSVGKVKNGQCRAGYVQDTSDSRICRQCPAGASSCHMDGSVTKAYPFHCMSGYFYDTTSTPNECKACPANCKCCSSETSCDGDGCKNYVDAKAAGVVGNGYARVAGADPQTNAICATCASDCTSCATNGAGLCDTCVSGYYHNSTSMLCVACNTGLANCGSCRMTATDTVVCDSCAINMAEVKTNNLITACHSCAATSHCGIKCTSADTCPSTGCDPDAYWANNICNACGRSTATEAAACTGCSSTSNQCASCTAAGFEDSPTAGICDTCTAGTNCNRCTAADVGLCTSGGCATGFFFNSTDSLCIDCTTATPGCATCAEDTGVCTSCIQPNYRFETTGKTCTQVACLGAPGKAATYANLKHSQLYTGQNCATGTPTGCSYGVYVVTGGVAAKYCPKNFCEDGYLWESNSMSSPAGDAVGVCTACPTGCCNCFRRGGAGGTIECKKDGCDVNFAKTTTGSCDACPAGCEECTYDNALSRTVCDTTKCKANYVEVATNICLDCPLQTTTCANNSDSLLISTDVSDGYVRTTENKPFKCGDNCKECTIDATNTITTCVTCNSLFAKNSATGICYACPSKCQECAYNGNRVGTIKTTCGLDKCDLGYVQDPTSKDCSQCTDSHCDYCENYSPKACKKGGCQSEYFDQIIGGLRICTKCSANCKQCNSTAACFPEQCFEGFYRDLSGHCQACLSGCKECKLNSDNTTTTCMSCKNNHAKRVATDGSNAVINCQTCTEGCNGCTFKDSSTLNVVCSLCVNGYHKDAAGSDGCKKCADNVLKCTATTIEECVPKYGKKSDGSQCLNCPDRCTACDTNTVCNVNHCAAKSYRTSAGLCVACGGNCNECDANGCKSMKCDMKYRRLGTTVAGMTSQFYVCERCSDQHCVECDVKKDECEKCPAYYYLDTTAKICSPCPANCPLCDKHGCTTCAAGYLVSSGQCANCPLHCKKCTLHATKLNMLCDSGQCMAPFALDATKEKCIDCPSLTGVAYCSNCTDLDPATNTSTCLSCVKDRYVLDDKNTTCLDCQSISDSEKCIDRKEHCTKCKHDLTPNKSGTKCGTYCAVCTGESCPLNPKLGDYLTNNMISWKFCDICTAVKEWESEKDKPKKKKTLLKLKYGCNKDLIAMGLVPSNQGAQCLADNNKCADLTVPNPVENRIYEACCYKSFEIPSKAGAKLEMSAWILLQMVLAVYVFINRG